MKWLLLISSVLVIALMIGAATSDMRSEWRQHQKSYRKILLAKAGDDSSRDSAKAFKVALQQVVVPDLNVTDRCVSCHTGIDDPRMAGENQPYRTHPGSILDQHPLSKFGCTTCHRGQGYATTNEDSKAVHAFWDYPMLPGKMVQASCGQCHDPKSLKGHGGDVLARGAEIFESSGCRSCHKLDGRGGALGIALDNEGRKVIHQLILTDLKGEHTVWNWLMEHFRDPQGVVAGSQMRYPALTEPEIEALTTYIMSLTTETLPKDYIAPDEHIAKYNTLRPGKPDAAKLYGEFCYSCHESGSYSRWDKTFKRFIPAIRGVGLATSPAGYLKEQIRLGREGTQMPGWHQQAGGLRDEEIDALIAYIRAGRQPVEPRWASKARGNASRGSGMYAQNCQGCHGIDGKGGIAPVLASHTFQKSASDAFILTTIQNGRPDTAMPAFRRPGKTGLTDKEMADVLAYIRSLK